MHSNSIQNFLLLVLHTNVSLAGYYISTLTKSNEISTGSYAAVSNISEFGA
jgi:hypothetical protein